jgi:hypothetical protein
MSQTQTESKPRAADAQPAVFVRMAAVVRMTGLGRSTMRPRLGHCDALAAQHDAGSRRAHAHSLAADLGHILGTAQGDSVGLHHGRQNLLPGVDAQTVGRLLHVAQHALYV